MVGVVVDDRDAVPLADELKAAAGAAEAREHRLRVGAGDPRQLERGERRRGIAAVVLAGHRELERHGLELPPSDDLRHLCQPVVEHGRDLGLGAEGRVVVELDVRDDADLGTQPLDRSVGLVALDDEPALPRTGVAAELADLAADEPRGIEAELGEDEGDHPGRRRLAMGSGDDDRAAQRDELGEELGARRPRHVGIGARHDGLPPLRHDRLGRDLDPDALELPQIRRLDAVPAADLGSPRPREEGVGGEAGAADADEPERA